MRAEALTARGCKSAKVRGLKSAVFVARDFYVAGVGADGRAGPECRSCCGLMCDNDAKNGRQARFVRHF